VLNTRSLDDLRSYLEGSAGDASRPGSGEVVLCPPVEPPDMADAEVTDLDGAEEVSEDNPYVLDPDTEFAPVEELGEDEAAEQAVHLREAVRFHDHRYYVLNDPVISDRAYDRLFDRLETLESAFDLATE